MSSKIKVQRICEYCNHEFTAQTTTTRYCSSYCNKAGYKLQVKNAKIEKSNIQTSAIKNKPILDVQAKEFLKVKEVAILLNCSLRSAYYYIQSGKLNSVNIGQRITRVKRSDIDCLFLNSNNPISNS